MEQMKKITLLFFLLFFLPVFVFSQNYSWEKVKSLHGINIKDLKELSSGKLVALADGIYLSDSNGQNWKKYFPLSDNLQYEQIKSMSVTGSGIIYVLFYTGAMYQSRDDGVNWIQIANIPCQYVLSFTSSNNYLFVMCIDGIYRSNFPFGWEKVIPLDLKYHGYDNNQIASDGKSKIIAWSAYPNLLWISNDEGNTWAQTFPGGEYCKLIHVSQNNEILLSIDTTFPTKSTAIYKTDNDGKNWKIISNSLPKIIPYSIATTNLKEIFIGSDDGAIYKSSDNGESWVLISKRFLGGKVNAILEDKNNIYAAGNGLIGSDNRGNSWDYITSGFPLASTKIIKKINSDELIIHNSIGLWLFNIKDESYKNIDKNDSTYDIRGIVQLDSNQIVLSTYQGAIFKTKNKGDSWYFVGITPGQALIFTMALDLNKNIWVGNGKNGVYRSTDLGESWELKGKHFTSCTSIITDKENNIYLTDASWMWKSTDAGETWSLENSFGQPGLKCSATSNDNIFVFGWYGWFWKSKDYGKSWTKYNYSSFGLDKAFLFTSVCEASSNHYYLGTDVGLFESSDGGETWKNVENEFKNIRINYLTKTSDGEIYMATDVGLYKNSILTNVSHIEEIVSEFSIEQNYPNPFNPTTTIKYSTPKHSNIEIKVFDVLGREITTLVNDIKAPGSYETSFNGRSLSSGVYYYQIKADQYFKRLKMLLVK